jgi:hypothetical protein
VGQRILEREQEFAVPWCVAELPAVLVLTYRDDELARDHPLQQLLGQTSSTERVHYLPLRRLSPDAVRELSAGTAADPDEVYAVTAGNPFFVSEVLAAGVAGGVPSSVAAATLARVRRLGGPAQDALEQLAVIPSTMDLGLVGGPVVTQPGRRPCPRACGSRWPPGDRARPAGVRRHRVGAGGRGGRAQNAAPGD